MFDHLKRYRVKKNGNKGWITWSSSGKTAIEKIKKIEGPGKYTVKLYSISQSCKDLGMPDLIGD